MAKFLVALLLVIACSSCMRGQEAKDVLEPRVSVMHQIHLLKSDGNPTLPWPKIDERGTEQYGSVRMGKIAFRGADETGGPRVIGELISDARYDLLNDVFVVVAHDTHGELIVSQTPCTTKVWIASQSAVPFICELGQAPTERLAIISLLASSTVVLPVGPTYRPDVAGLIEIVNTDWSTDDATITVRNTGDHTLGVAVLVLVFDLNGSPLSVVLQASSGQVVDAMSETTIAVELSSFSSSAGYLLAVWGQPRAR